MKPIGTHNYYVYITTNKNKTVLYTGVTNSLANRISAHEYGAKENKTHFTARYNCCYLIYCEHFTQITTAIAREKQIKGWTRAKKIALIEQQNPEWKFLNEELG
jgi:putative endonuclease